MATSTQINLAFVAVNSSGKAKARDRKLIRSHCMQGKNRRIGVQTKPDQFLAKTPEESAGRQYPSPQSSSPASERSAEPVDQVQDKGNEVRSEPKFTVPPPCPPDLALVRLACDVDRDSQELIFLSMTQGRDSMYPIELSIDFDLCRSLWFQWIFWDPAYLYCVLYGASATRDHIRGTPSTLAHAHLKSTIAHLNVNLSDASLALCDSTVAVVVMLAMVAGMTGDETSALAHVAGLKGIVRRRGGLDAFRDNTKLYMKIGRVDLAYSLITGENSLYFNDPISLASIFNHAEPSTYAHNPAIYGLRDERIAAIFQDLQYYTGVINQANATKQKRSSAEFQNVICSIQYRLMQLQESLEDILAECLRLAMLAFLTTTFQILGQGFRYPYLAKRFRECCLAIEATTPPSRDLMAWLLIVRKMALYDGEEDWVRRRWQCDTPKLPWPEARVRLKQIMWIDAIHDKPGRQVFDSLNSAAGDHGNST